MRAPTVHNTRYTTGHPTCTSMGNDLRVRRIYIYQVLSFPRAPTVGLREDVTCFALTRSQHAKVNVATYRYEYKLPSEAFGRIHDYHFIQEPGLHFNEGDALHGRIPVYWQSGDARVQDIMSQVTWIASQQGLLLGCVYTYN